MKQDAMDMHTIGRLVATALLAVTSAVAALLLVATAVATCATPVSNVIKGGSVPPNSGPSTRQKIEYEPWPPL